MSDMKQLLITSGNYSTYFEISKNTVEQLLAAKLIVEEPFEEYDYGICLEPNLLNLPPHHLQTVILLITGAYDE